MELNEATLEQILSRQREEFQRFVGAPVENLETKIELIAESIQGIEDRLKELTKQVDKSTDDIAMIKIDLGFIKAALDTLHRSIDGKAEREDLAALDARVATLERSANTLT